MSLTFNCQLVTGKSGFNELIKTSFLFHAKTQRPLSIFSLRTLRTLRLCEKILLEFQEIKKMLASLLKKLRTEN